MRHRADDSGPVSPPVLYVLLALGDRPRHGYAIIQEVADRTGGQVTLLPTSLYATLKRMRTDGLIEEVDGAPDSVGGPPRRTYRITERGRALAARELDRMAALLAMGREKEMDVTESTPGPAEAR